MSVVASFAGPPLFFTGHEAVGIADRGATLCTVHIAAERQRLTEAKPALAGEATLNNGGPEDQILAVCTLDSPEAGVSSSGACLGRGVVPVVDVRWYTSTRNTRKAGRSSVSWRAFSARSTFPQISTHFPEESNWGQYDSLARM